MRLAAVLGSCFLVTAVGCDRGELDLLPPSGAALKGDGADLRSRTDAGHHADSGSRVDAGRRNQFLGGGTVYECNSDLQCGARRSRCDQRTHRCVECLQTYECQPPTVCDTFTERCALPCQTSNDCSMSAQTRCDPNRHVCVGCTSDQQCVVPAPYCSPFGQCVECRDNNDCPSPFRFCTTNRNECVECLGDQDCASDQFCGAGRCVMR